MLIADRNGMVSTKKSAPTARDYVQTGLVAMWDGIENVGYGQHDDAAITWKDLVGSDDQTISASSPWFWTDNSYKVESPNVYQNIANSSGGTDPTYAEVCFRNGVPPSGEKFVLHFRGQKCLAVGAYTNIGGGFLKYSSLSEGTHSVGIDWTAPKVTDNGVELSGSGSAGTWYSSNVSLQIGYFGNNRYPFYGELFSIRLYSSALTAAEIAANYAVDSIRFNLTGVGRKCVVILIICAVCSASSRSRSPSRFSRPRQPSSEWRAAA